jgi:hypothetical protein
MLAAQDMEDARDAADRLQAAPRVRPLETALAVCYARPWTKSSIGQLGEQWLPEDGEGLKRHRDLIRLRNKLYAHTDDDLGARGIRDVSGGGKPTFATEWKPMLEEAVIGARQLAETQRLRFREAVDELSVRVRRFVVEIRWSTSIASPEKNVLLDELESELFALSPTSERATSGERYVEIDLRESAELGELAYAKKRLLRAVRQWWRQLRFQPDVHLTVGEQLYVLTADGPSLPRDL